MKEFLLLILATVMIAIACEKESELNDQKKEKITLEAKKVVLNVGDFEGLEISNRNGYFPFHSPFTLIDNDIFNPANFFINNIKLVDSVEYQRLNNDKNIYLGVTFNPFFVKYYYKNGKDTTFIRLAPEYIKDKETRMPILSYNQLHTNNNQHWIKISKTTRFDNVYSPYCGVNRLRYTYNVISSSGTNVNERLDSNCQNQLNYQMIF